MSDNRYIYSEEEGFFVDMAQTDDEHPDLGTELLTSDVLELLNDPESDKLVQYVRAERLMKETPADKADKVIELARESHYAYQALSDETRKAIEE